MLSPVRLFAIAAIFLIGTASGYAVDVNKYPMLLKLVDTMVAKDGYPRQQLLEILADAEIQQRTIDLMNRQYESLPWHRYREIFINDARINKGVAFWQENKAILLAAEQEFTVPPAVIVALIGVETHYGMQMGNLPVLNSLVTLTADFPRRSQYFSAELRQFLKTTRAEKIAANSVMGSYAGAIGIPQFMPASYHAYAVDFNGNGRRDLVNEMEDAIGSVANYLKVHGWKRNQGIFSPINSKLSAATKAKVSKRAKLTLALSQLIELGVEFNQQGASDKVALLGLKQQNGEAYFVGFANFHVITKYNPSVNYAMAVAELSNQIAAKRQ